MDVYFSPLACSLSTRITVYEAEAEDSVRLNRVNSKTQTLADGTDYRTINAKGLVPAVRADNGEVITENAAVLQYMADTFPKAGLAPAAGSIERYRLQQWLSFVGTELHKLVFNPLLSPKSNDGAKAYALEGAIERFDYLNSHLEGREYLIDHFSVADAYLIAVLNWAQFVGIDLAKWPAVAAYRDRVSARPAVARALKEEFTLYQAA
ncbi:glutathione binding-like protein [Phenylobacterium sp.]|uniref:glutathione binding-like protein n=1 Tax=Phenylobacterium sp. TaxID=1871053 RepID=UPI00286B8CC0|nr:glutathione binding-like protein [Phenylobacterium sp.]